MPWIGTKCRKIFLGSKRNLSPEEKHHESNLLWGPCGIGLSIVFTVIAAMKHDPRFLLYLAWPCFAFGAWHLAKRIPFKALSWWVTIGAWALVGSGLIGLGKWLTPEISNQPSTGTISANGDIGKGETPKVKTPSGGTPDTSTGNQASPSVSPKRHHYESPRSVATPPQSVDDPRIKLLQEAESEQRSLCGFSKEWQDEYFRGFRRAAEPIHANESIGEHEDRKAFVLDRLDAKYSKEYLTQFKDRALNLRRELINEVPGSEMEHVEYDPSPYVTTDKYGNTFFSQTFAISICEDFSGLTLAFQKKQQGDSQ